MNKICNIPIESIKPPWVVMRLVDKNSLDYLELRDSIRDIGITQSLSVRCIDTDQYELIAGLHRFTIAHELDIKIIPCIIVEADDIEVIQHQIQENCCLRRPNHIQLAKHVKRLLLADTNLTLADLAYNLHKSPHWVKQVLSLNRLIEPGRQMLEQCALSMEAGVILARLPRVIQEELLDDALNMPAGEFIQRCRQVSRAYKTASRQGQTLKWVTQYTVEPEPTLRLLSTLCTEYRECLYGSIFLSKNPKISGIEIWKAALAWILQLDPDSVEVHYDTLKRSESKRVNALTKRRDARAKLEEDSQKDLDADVF